MIEEKLFHKWDVDYHLLEKYGFSKNNDCYFFEKEMRHESFFCQVFISDSIHVKVFDMDLGEEYTGFRIENYVGQFASDIREEVEEILIDIRNHCFFMKNFVSDQANRISQMIFEKFGDHPVFEWEQYPDFGVFKHSESKKWYALIMNLERSKIGAGIGTFDIINVKLDSSRIPDLLVKDGFYPAYHMNKKNWISISLDDSLSDIEIMSYIHESYQFVSSGSSGRSTHEWIVPANPKYFDIDKAFQESPILTWKQSNQISVGDIVYIYVGSPVSAIRYCCQVIRNNIPYSFTSKNVSMKYVMKLKLLNTYEKDFCPFSLLKEYGVLAVRGPRFMPKKLADYLKTGDKNVIGKN